jgi:hypothetical protein
MAANDGEHPVREPFPGITVPDGTGATGSAPSRPGYGGPVPSAASGLPGVGTPVPLSGQAGEHHTVSSLQPGQNEGFPGGPDSARYTDTGAGKGNANPNPHPNGA